MSHEHGPSESRFFGASKERFEPVGDTLEDVVTGKIMVDMIFRIMGVDGQYRKAQGGGHGHGGHH